MTDAKVTVAEELREDKCINPSSFLYRQWEVLRTLSIIVTCLMIPYVFTFDSTQDNARIIIYVFDAVYLIDTLMEFILAHPNNQGILQYNHATIRKQYLRGWFAFDLLSLLPIELIALGITGTPKMQLFAFLQLNRFIRLHKVFSFFAEREEELGTNTALLRGLKYAVVSMFLTHFAACGWYMIACTGNHEGATLTAYGRCIGNSWVNNDEFNVEEKINVDVNTADAFHSYLTALYWSVASVTSTGYGDIRAYSYPERFYSTIVMLLGIAVFFGMLLGGMTSILTNFARARALFVYKENSIVTFLTSHSIPDILREQTLSFYDYLWSHKRGVMDVGLMEKLPIGFQARISEAMNQSIIRKASLFDGVDQGFLRMLSMRFHPELFLPNQIIINRADVGKAMYFIFTGEVEVLSQTDDQTPMVILKGGKLFGEMSLIYNRPCSATVRAKTHCDLMVLAKADYDEIIALYPEVAIKLRNAAAEIGQHAQSDSTGADTDSPFEAQQVHSATSIMTHKPDSTEGRRMSFSPSMAPSTMKGKALSKAGINTQRKNTLKVSNSVELIVPDDAPVDTVAQAPSGPLSFYTDLEIDPEGTFNYWWVRFIVFVVSLMMFVHPYMACFGSYEKRGGAYNSSAGYGILAFTYICDVIFIVDFFINLRVTLVTPHGLVKSVAGILKHQRRSGELWLNLLGIFPLEIFCLAWPAGASRLRMFAFFRLNKCINLHKIPAFFGKLEDSTGFDLADMVHMTKLLLYITIFTHWVACILYTIVCFGAECRAGSWIVIWAQDMGYSMDPDDPDSPLLPAVDEFIGSVYWAFVTMLSTGYGDITPHTEIGICFAMCAMFCGLLLHGYVTSDLAATYTNKEIPKVTYKENMQAVRQFMDKGDVNPNLQKRTVDYLSVLFNRFKGSWMPGDQPLLWDAPKSLQEDIAMETCMHSVLKVPLFRATSSDFARHLTLEASNHLYSFNPGDIIYYANEFGEEMYIINKGFCEVLNPDRTEVIGRLGPGDYFGIIGMLFGERHKVTVRADTNCEIIQLSGENLDEIVKDYPAMKKDIDDILAQNKELFVKAPPLKPTLEEDETELDGMKRMICDTSEPKKTANQQNFVFFETNDAEYWEPIQNSSGLVNCLSKLLLKRAFLPQGHVLTLICLFTIFATFKAVMMNFWLYGFFHDNLLIWFVCLKFDMIMYARMYARFMTAYYADNGVLVTHPLSTARRYLQTSFVFDLLCIFPFEIFVLPFTMDFSSWTLSLMAICRLNRCLLFFHIPVGFTFLESNVEDNALIIRGMRYFVYSLLIGATCFTGTLFMVGCPPEFFPLPEDTAVTRLDTGHRCLNSSWLLASPGAVYQNMTETENPLFLWVLSNYAASMAALVVGYGDYYAGTNNVDRIHIIIWLYIAAFYFGNVIASVSAVMTNTDAQKTNFAEHVGDVKHFLNDWSLSEGLRKRVLRHFDYVWRKSKGFDPMKLFRGFPSSLHGDITFTIYYDVISEFELFKGAEVAFVKMLSKYMSPKLLLEGEFVVRKHDIGDEMYFVREGVVDVVNEDTETIIETFRKGDGFGEISLIFNIPRTASIRCRTDVELFAVSRHNLLRVLRCFPGVKQQILDVATERRKKAIALSSIRLNKTKEEMMREFQVDDAPAVKDEIDRIMRTSGTSLAGQEAAPQSCAWNRFVWSRHSWGILLWNAWIGLLGIVSPWAIIYQAFIHDMDWWIMFVTFGCDIFFIIHIYVKMHTSFYDKHGTLVEDYDAIVANYKKNGWFKLDVYQVIPFEVLSGIVEVIAPGKGLTVMSVMRVLGKIPRIRYIFISLSTWNARLDANVLYVKLVRNSLVVFFVLHFFGCKWYWLACPHGECGDYTWAHYERTLPDLKNNKPLAYLTVMYWAVATMTSTGYGDIVAYTWIEMFVSGFLMKIAKFFFGFVLGGISSALASAEMARVDYDERMASFKSDLVEHNDQSEDLNKQVTRYCEYLWKRTRNLDFRQVLSDLPRCLMSDVYMEINDGLLNSVSLIKDFPQHVKRAIAPQINQLVFMPEDIIVQQADPGTDVFYVKRGSVEIMEGGRIVETMGPGSVLGERFLAQQGTQPHVIRSHGYTDILTLPRESLESVLKDYPVEAAKFNSRASGRF